MYRVVTISPSGCRDYRLPPAVSGPDDDRRMVLAEPVQAKHLVIFVRYQPQPARSFLHFVPPGVRRILPSDEAREQRLKWPAAP